MAVPMLDIARQHAPLWDELRQAFDRVLTTGKFVVPSPEIDALEASLVKRCGTRQALTVSSGTDALLIALMALGIGPGDEVITCPFTFFATAGSIARLGAKPVFVDIDPVTFNINPKLIEAAITPRTRAIMPVHLFGQAADMKAIAAIAARHKLHVIEDAAQAIGARDHDQPVGSFGAVGCLSFYPTKNLAALGDGGAVTVSDADLYARLKAIRVHGQTGEYQHELIGGNFRLDAVQAALLNVKIKRLDGWTAARREAACRYHQLLEGVPVVRPHAGPEKFHVYNQYTIRIQAGRRDDMKKHLLSRGIGCRVYYPLALHLQPCFAYLGCGAGRFPESEKATAEVLSLPMFPDITPAQQEEVVRAVREFFQG